VVQHADDAVVDRHIAGVGELELEHRDRDRGVTIVQRDERIERGHGYRARAAHIVEVQPRDGKAALEPAGGEMRHGGKRIAPHPEAEIAPEVAGEIAGAAAAIGTIQDARVQHLAVALGAHGKMRDAIGAALVRAIQYFPVD
jgi:hypothetical protein